MMEKECYSRLMLKKIFGKVIKKDKWAESQIKGMAKLGGKLILM